MRNQSRRRPITNTLELAKSSLGVALLGAAIVILVGIFLDRGILDIFKALSSSNNSEVWPRVLFSLLGIGYWILLGLVVQSLLEAFGVYLADRNKDVVVARVRAYAAKEHAWVAMAYATAGLIAALLIQFFLANDNGVGKTFFQREFIAASWPDIRNAFLINLMIFAMAGVASMIGGMFVALGKLAPGRTGRPIRMMANAYTDIFLSLPAVIVIYLIGFGLPITRFAILENIPLEVLAAIALTLTYSAYLGEAYRAGLESIHPSQWAAARSLGLSYGQTLRTVIIPQAVRRIIPPILTNLISLQKDTALVGFVGVIDAFNQSKIIASNDFNLSAVSTVALIFIVLTIPQTRFVDWLMAKENKRTQQGGR